MKPTEWKDLIAKFILFKSIENDKTTNELNRLGFSNMDVTKMLNNEIERNTISFINNKLKLTLDGQKELEEINNKLTKHFKIESSFSYPLYSYFDLLNNHDDFFIPEGNDLDN